MQKAISFFKLLIGNLLMLLLLTFVTNILLGFYLNSSKVSRADLPNYDNNRALGKNIFYDYGRVGHEYAPFMGWKTLPYSGETLNIGNDGFRKVTGNNSDIKLERLKVGFFGGSTLWGEGASGRSLS